MTDIGADYLTVDQVAATLQVAPQAVRRWIQRDELPALRLGGQRMGFRVARADLDAFLGRDRPGPRRAVLAPRISSDLSAPLRWTRTEYDRMTELGLFDGRRVELLDGEIIEMAPMNRPHADALERLKYVLEGKAGRSGVIRPRLLEDDLRFVQQVPLPLYQPVGPDDSAPEPDGIVLNADGVPLLVIEISDSTLADDLHRKPHIYAGFDVPDYWVIDLNGRQLHSHAGPLPTGAYQVVMILEADATITVPGGVGTVAVAELLGPADS